MTDDFIMRAFASTPNVCAPCSTGRGDPQTPVEDATEQDSEEHETEAPEAAPAPSTSDAAPEGTSAPERRETGASRRAPIYGTRRKETSKPWLLGPSKSTNRT
jgi:hypothetical protein